MNEGCTINNTAHAAKKAVTATAAATPQPCSILRCLLMAAAHQISIPGHSRTSVSLSRRAIESLNRKDRPHTRRAVPEAMTMVANLVAGHEATARTAREVLAAAEEAGDAVTVDLATRRLDVHEKTAWMLRSLLD